MERRRAPTRGGMSAAVGAAGDSRTRKEECHHATRDGGDRAPFHRRPVAAGELGRHAHASAAFVSITPSRNPAKVRSALTQHSLLIWPPPD